MRSEVVIWLLLDKLELSGDRSYSGSSDQCVFCFVDAEDLQFEERTIPEAVGLTLHGLDLVLVPSKGPVEIR